MHGLMHRQVCNSIISAVWFVDFKAAETFCFGGSLTREDKLRIGCHKLRYHGVNSLERR